MRSLLLKQLGDIGDYFAGTAQFHAEASALDSWTYPLDLEFTLRDEDAFFSPRDADGIPMRVYRSAGRQYNPTRIAAWGLAHFNRHALHGTPASLGPALLAADWLAGRPDGVWPYEFDWNDLRRPWISCMSQGQGISLLIRAHQLTGEERYLTVARAALVPFTRRLDEGGVRSLIDGCHPFLEEYPSRRPAHVLNGFLFALLGLSDLQRVDASAAARAGFDSLLETLDSTIDRWDLGYWSAYDLAEGPARMRNTATPSYHRLHISQLTYLARRHALPRVADVAGRWERYTTALAGRVRALLGKVVYRGLVRAQR